MRSSGQAEIDVTSLPVARDPCKLLQAVAFVRESPLHGGAERPQELELIFDM